MAEEVRKRTPQSVEYIEAWDESIRTLQMVLDEKELAVTSIYEPLVLFNQCRQQQLAILATQDPSLANEFENLYRQLVKGLVEPQLGKLNEFIQILIALHRTQTISYDEWLQGKMIISVITTLIGHADAITAENSQ